MSFRLTCVFTVCSAARLDKHEQKHQSFASILRRINWEQMETPHTGPAMRKPLIRHQRSYHAKSIIQTTKFRTIDRL